MHLLHGIDGLHQLPRGSALSIGNYDGVHRGHATIIQRLREFAAGGPVAIVTFEPHPLTVLRPQLAPPRLTAPAIKHRLLQALGVTHLVELPPSQEVLNLDAQDFFAILRDHVGPTHIVEGPGFNFGKARGGNVQKMIEWSRGTEIQVHALPAEQLALLDLSLAEVSSTLVRWLLSHGRVRDAAICLGRPYTLAGEVVKGFQRGREIGTPTANLDVKDQLIPDDGVYVARCCVNGVTHPVALSIGSIPTFTERAFQVEAHLLDFEGDLYGHSLEVDLLDHLREQRKYSSIDTLKLQIARDIARVRECQNLSPEKPIAFAGR